MQFVTPQDTNDVLQWTVEITRRAGKKALEYFGGPLTKQSKGHPNDYATDADIAIEQFLVEHIQERFPGDAILAEEGGWYGGTDAEKVWIIDPIDGTSNFANHIPEYGIMIARTHGDEVALSVVYNPSQDVLAYAQRGRGTYLNEQRVHAPLPPTLQEAHAIFGVTYDRFQRSLLQQLRKTCETVLQDHCTYHSAAASALHLLQNDQDAYLVNSMKTWDTAPISLLIQEAGYMMTTLQGKEYRWKEDDQSILAAHPHFHAQLKELIENSAS